MQKSAKLGTFILGFALVFSFAPSASAASCGIWADIDNDEVTLRWTATSDSTSAQIDNGIGNVSLSGSRYIGSLSSDRTYRMSVSGHNSVGSCQTTVEATDDNDDDRPSCSITFTPSYNYGGAYSSGNTGTLSWSSWDATSASISPNIGSVATNGSRTVYNYNNQAYTMTVYGNGDSNTCRTNSSNPYPPQQGNLYCTITANPSTVQNGAAASLSWTSTGATRAWLSDGIGNVVPNGSLLVRPNGSRSYTLTISDNVGRTQTCQAFVLVSGSYVPLTQIPYTGGAGPLGTALAWLAVTLASGAGAVMLARTRFGFGK